MRRLLQVVVQVLIGLVLPLSLWLVWSPAGAQSMDWPLHDLNLAKNRYAPLDQINTSNVDRLAVTWSFDAGGPIGKATPLVVDGVMYVNTSSKLVALNATTGAELWSVPY